MTEREIYLVLSAALRLKQGCMGPFMVLVRQFPELAIEVLKIARIS